MYFIDENDSLNAFTGIMPKVMGNLPIGDSTFGIYEYVVYLDDLFYNAWMTTAATGNMGLLWGLVLTTFATRVCFMPL